ncbi:unconventional prefoldin RPB5 interactor 1-like [Saccostrea cucullata]|uniref:unconventional prefoldin RPB5 interactor 1-like n=1 Tax=Saccostrea cuccullata TaxID=36930 RepID=UPI002ED14851
MDLKHIKRLEEEQKLALFETDRKIKQWETFRSDYEALKKRLTTLPDKTKHDVMVPFGPLAFMPGQLVHTNEILVLLGDNWFAERSAKQATEIIGRRITTVQKQIDDLQAQKRLLEPRLEFTKNIPGGSTNEDYFEITEEYDADKEKLWREEHRKSIQRQRKKEKIERKSMEKEKTLTDEEIWKRLDELEKQESERQELQRISVETADVDFMKTLQEDMSVTSPSQHQTTRKVHFQEEEESSSMVESEEESEIGDSDDFSSDTEEEEEEEESQRRRKTQVINFSHAKVDDRLQREEANSEEDTCEVRSPRDIYRLYKPDPKSILKNSSSNVKRVNVKKKSDRQRAPLMGPSSSLPTAFSGVVVEKKVPEPMPTVAKEQTSSESRPHIAAQSEEIQRPVRVSKFKAQRQNLSKH